MADTSAFERPKSYEYAREDSRKLSETMKKYLEYYTQEISTLQRDLLRAEVNLSQEERYAEVRARMETIVKETEEALRTNGEQTETLFKKIEDLIAEAEAQIFKKKRALPEGRKRYGERMHDYWTKRIESQKFIQGERVYRGGKPVEHVIDLPNRWEITMAGIVLSTHGVSMSRRRWYLKNELPSELTFTEGEKTMVFRTNIEGDRVQLKLKENPPERSKTPEEEVKATVIPHGKDFLRWYELSDSERRTTAKDFKDALCRTAVIGEREVRLVVSQEREPRCVLVMEVDSETHQLMPFRWMTSIALDTKGAVQSVQLRPKFDFDHPPKDLPQEARLAIYMVLGLNESQVIGGTVEWTREDENLVFIFKKDGAVLGRVRVKPDGSAERIQETSVTPPLKEDGLSPEERKVWGVFERERGYFQKWWGEDVQWRLREPRDNAANLERIKRGFGTALGKDSIDIMVSSNVSRVLIVEEGRPFHALAIVGISTEGRATSIQMKPSLWNNKEVVQLALAVKFGIERKGDLDRIHVDEVQPRGEDKVIHFTRNGKREEMVVDMKTGDERLRSRPE
ncbi:hypothetical protein A2635_01925 [Candidatus Peribacteria bacterium RIFCSPHIGHO2_01_FULL_51_9]|nr:MAG: hypothetical protein A2635_01925 [Candidatus Peribacteria bacterium RIFCSPHIGHO2_01_FULL_51_9]